MVLKDICCVIGADCRFCVLLVGGPRLAEDQEINSAGWNWAGVASIWGVARIGRKKSSKLVESYNGKVSNKPLPFVSKRYPKDIKPCGLVGEDFFLDTSTVRIIHCCCRSVGGMFEDSNCSIVKSC